MINTHTNAETTIAAKGVVSPGRMNTPWYRQFWPWFVLALPATAVVAGMVTIYIAFNNADSLVNDSYYRDGLAINQQLAQDLAAERLNLSAKLVIDTVSGELLIELAGDFQAVVAIELLLLHPGDEKRDSTIQLNHITDNRFRADLEQLPQQRYYLRLQPVGSGEWRLNGEINFSTQTSLVLNHNDNKK